MDSLPPPPLLRKFDALCHNRKAKIDTRNFPHGEQREGSENMSGKRQPTALVEANGRKHLTQAEADERRDREIYMPPADEVTPPKWLPKRLRPEYCEIGEMLNGAGLYAELDRDVLGQYFICRDRWTKADKKAAAAISKNDEKLAKEWTSIQGAYFKQARQCAEAMGLSVTSRCRIVVPTAVVNAAGAAASDQGGTDEFTEMLRRRQDSALSRSASGG